MKRTYKLLKNKMISRSLGVLAVSAVVVFLAGCAKGTMDAGQCVPMASSRQADFCALESNGVQVIKLGQTVRLVLSSNDLFRSHSANLRPGYRYVLKQVASLLNTYRIVTVKVAAYSARNTKHINALTKARAQAVQSYLSDRGVKARLIYAVGESNKHPVASNNTEAGRNVNRRVEISFQYYTLGNNDE